METAVLAGEYGLAENARLDAYAIMESGPEARITAFAPQFKTTIEDLFWQGSTDSPGLAQLLQQHAPAAQVRSTRRLLDAELRLAQRALAGSSEPAAVAINAGVIVFREGLEAVLILASLMASFKALNRRHFRLPMWLGSVAALIASVVTWLVMRGAIQSFARYGEKLEAVVSIIAIAVLLLITNWFFHDVYWKGWMTSLHKQKQRKLSGSAQFAGLMMLGFTSIYREGFETALFLQALVLEAGVEAVLMGSLAGMAGVALCGAVVFVLQGRLPAMKMLIATGIMIGAILLVMVGNTVHTLQVVGWLTTTPLREVQFPYWVGLWLGTYPTYEGLAAQLLAALFVIGSYVLAERINRKSIHRQRDLAKATR
jgi:high-affinity iron transporter